MNHSIAKRIAFILIAVQLLSEPHSVSGTMRDIATFRQLLCRFCCSAPEDLCFNYPTRASCYPCDCCPNNVHAVPPTVRYDFKHMQVIEPFRAYSPVRRTCECPHSSDNDRKCSFWAHIGECERIPGFMLTMCPVSCGICC